LYGAGNGQFLLLAECYVIMGWLNGLVNTIVEDLPAAEIIHPSD
jgi:hypothetical protein